MKIYVTFTKHDRHIAKGLKFNHHCVAVVECEDRAEGMRIIERAFGGSYRFDYTETEFEINGDALLRYCSRGLVVVPADV